MPGLLVILTTYKILARVAYSSGARPPEFRSTTVSSAAAAVYVSFLFFHGCMSMFYKRFFRGKLSVQ